MLVRIVLSWVTRLPGATRRSEIRPVSGEVTRVKLEVQGGGLHAALGGDQVGRRLLLG